MPPIFPSNYPYPKQGYVISFPKQIQKDKFYVFDDMMIESIINTIVTQSEQRKIENVTFLSLVDLVKPGSKKCKDKKIPRSQNVFLIFRKDLQARLAFEKGPSFTSDLKFVSSIASSFWKSAPTEQKILYDRISAITKEVHKHLWPDYSYRPNRREHRDNFNNFQNMSCVPSPPSPPPLLPPPFLPPIPSILPSPPRPPFSSLLPLSSSSSLLPLPLSPPSFPPPSNVISYPSSSPDSTFSPLLPPPYYQNQAHLLEPSITINKRYDECLCNRLNKFII